MGKDKIPEDVLNDLCSRFLINVPQEEKDDMVQVCFHIEMARWFYLDFYQEEEPDKLPYLDMRKFTVRIFKYLPHLSDKVDDLDKILLRWREYKARVPVYGAVLLNEDLTKCLLVQSYYSKTSWGFPRGKVNKEEPPLECAIREVLEETGFDFRSLKREDDFIDKNQDGRSVRLYIVPGVPYSTPFKPKARKEIRECRWFDVAHLPASKNDQTPMTSIGMSPKNFFMVWPVVKTLRKWINQELTRARPRSNSQLLKAVPKPGAVTAPSAPVVVPSTERSLMPANSHLLEQALLAEVDAKSKGQPQPSVHPVATSAMASKPHRHQPAPLPSSTTRQPVASPLAQTFPSIHPVLSYLPTQQFQHATSTYPASFTVPSLPLGPHVLPGLPHPPPLQTHSPGPPLFLPISRPVNTPPQVPFFQRLPVMAGSGLVGQAQLIRPHPVGVQPPIRLATALHNFEFDHAALLAAMDEGLQLHS